jgi:hypothetical protein
VWLIRPIFSNPAPCHFLRSRALIANLIAGARGNKRLERTNEHFCERLHQLCDAEVWRDLADPPWSFRNWSVKGTGRNAISHYDCLTYEELAALPVADLAADDCALFLWAVDPLWIRPWSSFAHGASSTRPLASIGSSRTARARALSLASDIGREPIRNNACLQLAASRSDGGGMYESSLLSPDVDTAANPIACGSVLSGGGPYLERFARQTKMGWDCWGDQASLFDQSTVATRRQPSRLIDRSRLLPT